MNERELLVEYRAKKEALDALKEKTKEAQKEYDTVEGKMVEHLTELGADSTASYDGIGYAKLMKPRVYASCLKENEEALKAYLIEKGREDLIREAVSAPALSGYVGELVEAGKPVPELISYYLKQGVRVY